MFSQSMKVTKSTATVYGYGWVWGFFISFARVTNDQGPDEGLKCWWAGLLCTLPCPQSVRQMLRKGIVSSLLARGASLWRTTMIQLCLQLFPSVPHGGLISCVLATWTSTSSSQFPSVAFVQWGCSLVAVEAQQRPCRWRASGAGKRKRTRGWHSEEQDKGRMDRAGAQTNHSVVTRCSPSATPGSVTQKRLN